MGLIEGIFRTFGPDVAIGIIKKIPWRKVGKEQSKPLDTILDSQFKEKKSEALQAVIAPAIDEFFAGFKEGLLEDQKE